MSAWSWSCSTSAASPAAWSPCTTRSAASRDGRLSRGRRSAADGTAARDAAGGSDGTLVGTLYLHHDEPRGWHGYSLGYVFHPDEWHQGYATEACRALLDVCFRQWGAHRVSARCDPRNEASWRLLERLGLRREGHVRQAASFSTDDAGRPVWHDAYLYAVLDTEWDPEG